MDWNRNAKKHDKSTCWHFCYLEELSRHAFQPPFILAADRNRQFGYPVKCPGPVKGLHLFGQ